jgi:hypothetical protein
MIFLILIILIVVGGLGYQKFRGTQALAFTFVDVTGLTLDEITTIGTKSSRSLAGRITGAAPAVRQTADRAEWTLQTRGGEMAFRVDPLPGGAGYRVGGAATAVRIGQTTIGSNRGTWGLAKAMSNAIYRALGIPQNASQLVSRRKRVLGAITAAGTVVAPASSVDPVAR